MNVYRSNNLENIWLTVILIHVIGSSLVAFILGIRFGLVAFNSFFWIYFGYVNRQKKAAIFFCALGWFGSLYLYNNMPLNYLVPFLLNVMLMGFLLFLHYGDPFLLAQENKIKIPERREIIVIVPLTIFLFIASGYVNAVSMLFFENYITDTLNNVKEGWGYAIVALAFAPALVEEIIYRGMVFRYLGNGKKAILVSAALFALGHMNFNQISYAFVMGLSFALVFRTTGNLTITISIHFLFNLFSVITNAFVDTPVIQKILEIQVWGYHPFDGQLLDASGKIMVNATIAGGIMALASALLIGCILHFVLKYEQVKTYEGVEKGPIQAGAYIGILICMYVAFFMK